MNNNDQNSPISDLLTGYDKKNTPYKELDIFYDLKELLNKHPDLDDSVHLEAEMLAFGLEESFSDKCYYGSFKVSPLLSLKTSEQKDLSHKVNSDHVLNWKTRLDLVSHPLLKVRYSDLIWEFSKSLDNFSPDKTDIETTIDETINLLTLESGFQHPIEAENKIRRAIGLAAQIKDSERLSKLVNVVIEFESKYAINDMPGTWGYSFDILILDKKIAKQLEESQSTSIIQAIEERFSRLLSQRSFESLFACASRLSFYYKRCQNKLKIRTLLEEFDKAVISMSQGISSMVAESWLRKALEIHNSLNTKNADRESLLKAIQDLRPEFMKLIQGSVSIPQDELKKYLESFSVNGLDHALEKIGRSFHPIKSDVAKSLEQLSGQYIHSLFASTIIQDAKGRTMVKLPSYVEDIDPNVKRQFAQDVGILTVFLNLAIEHISEKLNLDSESLLSYLFSCDVFKLTDVAERRDIYEKGLNFYFAKDWFTCVHILVPQIEHLARSLVAAMGGVTYRLNRYGGFNFLTLGELLGTKELSSAFCESSILYFRLLLNEPTGCNLRNDLSHGMITLNQADINFANRVFHVFLMFALLKFDTHKAD